MINTTKRKIDRIYQQILHGIDISYTDLLYLQEHTKEIKRYFPDEPMLWENAGIDEAEWQNQ